MIIQLVRDRIMVVGVLVLTGTVLAMAQAEVSRFSGFAPGETPPDWESLQFSGVDEDTRYRLVEDGGRVVLRADSRGSASALLTRVSVDTVAAPYLHWSWKGGRECFSGDWRDPDRDDFPLRLFVIFEPRGGLFSLFRRMAPGFPGEAVLYVADGVDDTAADRASHLSGRIRVLPMRQRRGSDGWSREVRNLREDYVALFGREPRAVAGVAVMTDTDNSGTSCTSHFGDIRFSERRD